jgi:hypothetical protein
MKTRLDAYTFIGIGSAVTGLAGSRTTKATKKSRRRHAARALRSWGAFPVVNRLRLGADWGATLVLGQLSFLFNSRLLRESSLRLDLLLQAA